MQLEAHEYANTIPDMTPEQYEQLVEDIGANGLIQPIILYNDKILDGRNRYRACCELQERGHAIEPRFERYQGDNLSAYAYVLSLNLHRRHLEFSQRAALAAQWKRMLQDGGQVKAGRPNNSGDFAGIKGEARQVSAEKFQVGSKAVDEAERVMEKAPDLFEQMIGGGIGLREAQREVKERERSQRLEAAKAAVDLSREQPADKRYRLIWDHIGAVTEQLEPESVDVIITDPPYPQEYLELYSALGILAAKVLKPGGSLIAMAGQSYLPDVMERLCNHMAYHWTVSYLTPGGQAAQVWQRKVNTFWKPVLWFVKGEYSGGWIGDVAKSDTNDNDKRFHEWGQSVSGMSDLVERMSQPNDLILDPFCGGGATGVAALQLGRRFIGADKSEDAIAITLQRITEVI